MKKLFWILNISLFALISCEKDDDIGDNEVKFDLRFVPTDVIVKTKGYYTIDKVFEFINLFNHEVESIRCSAYTSTLPSDSLNYVLNYLNTKTYTHDGERWYVTGYLHYATQVITIFPKLFDIKNLDNQADWLQSMDFLNLREQTDKEVSGNTIYFHVPEGQEKEWVRKFEKYHFVEWVELNYTVDLNPWP